jgi:hypothetical protein
VAAPLKGSVRQMIRLDRRKVRKVQEAEVRALIMISLMLAQPTLASAQATIKKSDGQTEKGPDTVFVVQL